MRGSNTGAAPIPFGGLSTGGGGAGGVQLDVGDFCCPEYLATMNQRITTQLEPEPGGGGPGDREVHDPGATAMLTNVEVDQSSQQLRCSTSSRGARSVYDSSCRRCPAQFTEPTLTVHLTFEYKR